MEYDPELVAVGGLVEALRAAGFDTGGASLRLKVTGLYCSACVSQIEGSLQATSGVLEATMNAATEEVKVDYLPAAVDFAALERAVEEAGPYEVTQTEEPGGEAANEDSQQDKEYRRLMRKWWFGAAVAVPTMTLSYPWLFPVLRDILPRGSTELRLV